MPLNKSLRVQYQLVVWLTRGQRYFQIILCDYKMLIFFQPFTSKTRMNTHNLSPFSIKTTIQSYLLVELIDRWVLGSTLGAKLHYASSISQGHIIVAWFTLGLFSTWQLKVCYLLVYLTTEGVLYSSLPDNWRCSIF